MLSAMKKSKTSRRKAGKAVVGGLASPWVEVRKKVFGAQRRKANDEKAERLLTLMELRNEFDITQVELADALSITQSALSKLERQADTKLSTLRHYVEKLGGSLVVKARFGDIEKELHFGARGLGSPPGTRSRGRAGRARAKDGPAAVRSAARPAGALIPRSG